MKNTEVIKSGSGELLWAFRGTGGVHGALPRLQVATWAPGLIGPLGEGADWSAASPVAQEALAGPSPGSRVTRPALNNPLPPTGKSEKQGQDAGSGGSTSLDYCTTLVCLRWAVTDSPCLPFYRIYLSQATISVCPNEDRAKDFQVTSKNKVYEWTFHYMHSERKINHLIINRS